MNGSLPPPICSMRRLTPPSRRGSRTCLHRTTRRPLERGTRSSEGRRSSPTGEIMRITTTWDFTSGAQARSEVDRVLRAEVKPTMTEREVRLMVDEILEKYSEDNEA